MDLPLRERYHDIVVDFKELAIDAYHEFMAEWGDSIEGLIDILVAERGPEVPEL